MFLKLRKVMTDILENPFKNISEANRLKAIKYSKKGIGIAYAIVRFALLSSTGFIILYPLLYMIVTSVMNPSAFGSSTRVWIPTGFNMIENYSMAWQALDYGNSIINTFKFEIASSLLEVVSCAVIGYGFARFEFKGKKIFTAILFLTILIPDMMVLVPRMGNFKNLDFLGIGGGIESIVHWFGDVIGWDFLLKFDITPKIINTGWTLWLPSIFGVGLRSGVLIYIYIQFFTGLPRELEEAAWVDGAGPFKTFLRIAVPSSSVVFITVTVFSVVWHWNDSLLSGMYFTSQLPLGNKLSAVEDYIGAVWGLYKGSASPQQASIIMAACLMFVAPVLIFYMIVQRGFVESIDRVGITG